MDIVMDSFQEDQAFENHLEAPAVTPVIETRNVSKIYYVGGSEVRAVDNVSITINPGEFVGLVGPSGSGKTTMLAMLAALLEPSQGEVRIDGIDLHTMSEKQRVGFRRERIGFTFQSNNLVPYLTVRENVEFMLRLNGRLDRADQQRIDELLVRLGLQDRLKSLPNQLSGGQRQRVAIARSLIHNPSVVLADEPTASLDTERAFQVVQLYADLIHEQHRAGIMVTHDLRMCRYVDKIIQFHDGRLETVITGREQIDDLIRCG
jgi:putative ABC transport system ATP-binding protein